MGPKEELKKLRKQGRAGTQRAENRQSCTSRPWSVTLTRQWAWGAERSRRSPAARRAATRCQERGGIQASPGHTNHGVQRSWGARKRTHKPLDAEGGLREPRQVRPSPATQTVSSEGLREARTSLHDAEGRAGEPRKDPRKTELARFGLQCRVGLGNRCSSNDSKIGRAHV